MRSLSRFLSLAPADRTLLVVAIPLVAAVRLALYIVPFATLYRSWSSFLPRVVRTGDAKSASPERIVWLVAVASRCVPGAHCLTRAAAAQLLLARAGHLAEMRIGVRKQGDGLEAHAWLEHEGAPISESEEKISGYSPFPPTFASPFDRHK